MANEFVQTMSDARVDARSLSDFVFKPAGFKVPRRLAPPIDTLQFYIDRLNATKAATDTYVATIPTIVNNAINNTAVEGGVLADTFVTATAYGSGSIARTQREINAERVSVHDFGAIGDGTLHTVAEWIPSRFTNLAAMQAVYPKVTALTDYIDRVAIQACIDSCVVSGKIAEGVAGSKYCIDKQVDIVSNADFSCCKFIVSNTYTGKVVSTSAHTLGKLLLRNLVITYPEVTNKSVPGDAHYGATGIYLEGVRNCNMTFNDIYGMETNLHLYSNENGSYISYNNYYFEGLISRSKVNVLIEVVGDGWINQCQWWGGQFARYSQDTLASTTTCVKFRKADAVGNNGPNGHSFFGCSMEGAFTRTIDYDYDPLLKTTFYSVNRWVACRFEQAAMSRFNSYSLYDKLDGCYISPEMVFENDVTPNMDGCTRHFKSNIDVADLIGTTRNSTRTHRFSALNSANALALSVGTDSLINASITSGGAFGGYHPTQTDKLHPMINCGVIFGVPTISMGDGVAEASDRIYRAAVGDWRLNFNLLPSTSETYNLGSTTYKYNQVHAKQVHLSGSVGFFGTYPITTKPVVTGSKTDGTALASLIDALTNYGLITNSTT